MPVAVVNKIIPQSFVDGPGNRMAIFLQGCNMSCKYCHNPETQNYCNACGICVDECSAGALQRSSDKIVWQEELCLGCDRCVAICPHCSTPKTSLWSVGGLYRFIKERALFLDGITFSGGECTLQYEFVSAVCELVKKNTELTCLLDTNGFFAEHVREKLLPVVDGFMFDFKCKDSEMHQCITGVGNLLVWENIQAAAACGKAYEVRTVLVDDYTANKAEIRAMWKLLKTLPGDVTHKLIPFHNYGVRGEWSDKASLDAERYAELVIYKNNLCEECK